VLTLQGNDVRPGHRGEFRVLIAARRTGLGQVRAYLAADLLRRISERSRLAPTVIDLHPDGEDELRSVCGQLNIHPPRQTMTPPVTAEQLGGLFADGVREPVFDLGVRVVGSMAAAPGASLAGTARTEAADAVLADTTSTELAVEALARYWIEVAGPVDRTDVITARKGGAGAGLGGEDLVLGDEPLSVRMMLLRHGYGEPLGGGGDHDGAAQTLARWRELVARWARSPSGAMSRRYSDAIRAAFAEGLDTAAALRELAVLAEDAGEPDGVKFETFAAADLLFGLDLARDVGR
jgi:hypothetical protein